MKNNFIRNFNTNPNIANLFASNKFGGTNIIKNETMLSLVLLAKLVHMLVTKYCVRKYFLCLVNWVEILYSLFVLKNILFTK